MRRPYPVCSRVGEVRLSRAVGQHVKLCFEVRSTPRPVVSRLLAAVTFALMLLIGSASSAASVSLLIDRLKNGEDFRVRVQAALELGKSKSAKARVPLEQALDDNNAAVRAAAAAALKAHGDKRSIVALERHRKDSSPAVRSQIEHSIAALRAITHKEKPQGAGEAQTHEGRQGRSDRALVRRGGPDRAPEVRRAAGGPGDGRRRTRARCRSFRW